MTNFFEVKWPSKQAPLTGTIKTLQTFFYLQEAGLQTSPAQIPSSDHLIAYFA